MLHENFNGGYTPFWVSIPPSNKSMRELIVMADNRFDSYRTPTQFHNYDWYQYGGLIRAVTLHQLDEGAFIRRLALPQTS